MQRSNLTAVIGPVVAPLGLVVDGVAVKSAGKRQLVQVRLDGDGPRGTGPDMDQIAAAAKAISQALDQVDMGSQPYVLEVSSRGVDTPLTSLAHFRRNTGRLVAISLVDGQSLAGRIAGVSADAVTIDEPPLRQLRLADIAKAVVQVEFNRTDDDVEGEEQ